MAQNTYALKNKLSFFPFFLGMGFCWAAEEMASLFVLPLDKAPFGTGASTYFIFVLCFSIAGLALALFSKKIVSLFNHAWVIIVAPLLGIIGISFLNYSLAAPTSGLLFLTLGMMLVALCGVIINVLWMELFSFLSLAWVRLIVILSTLITVVFVPFYRADPLVVTFVGSGLFLLSALCLYISWKKKHLLKVTHKNKVTRETPLFIPVVAGAAIIALAFGFLQFSLYDQSAPSVVAIIALSHLLATVMLALLVIKIADNSYSLSFRVIGTLLVLAFLILSAISNGALFASFLTATAFSIFEYLLVIALVDFSSYSKTPKLKIFGLYSFLTGFAQACGCLLSFLDLRIVSSQHAISYIGVAIAALLIVSSLWFMSDTSLNRFFWGKSKSSTDSTLYNFEENAQKVAQLYSLTQREEEILQLYASGRSSTYIAESLFVSTNTIRSHITRIYSKCDVHSRQELITLIEQQQA